MQYYLIEWQHEEPDEPWQLYLELDDQGHLLRKVESYRFGLSEPSEIKNGPCVDPRQLAGESGFISSLYPSQFQDLWERCRELPNNFMELYF